MLEKVIVQTSTPVEFKITDVDPDEILILSSVSGLTQAGATLYTGEFAGEGGYYQGRRAKQRFPILNFKLNPDYKNDIDAEDIRDILYRTFMEPQNNSDGVQVGVFTTKKPELYFIGYTEDIDATLFNKELGATVSMSCTDAYLRSAQKKISETPGGWLSVPIFYDGSADTGFEVIIKIVTDTPELTLENNGIPMRLVRNFVAGELVRISTEQGSRAIQVGTVEDSEGGLGGAVDIMASLRGSNWLKLSSQVNTLRVYGLSPGDGKVLATSYRYRSAWWGI